MAHSLSQPVKSLNKSPGRRRFVFKSFSQRVEEIEIDVFRSLDPVKPDPADGSTFFKESLIYWRELNTAEDFISFYEEMMPWAQTLPQILLHKETIISKLLSRLRLQAKLSLEPILRLIAALSRDLLEDFLPFLPRIAVSLVDLLKSGGDREPEILEQVFTSWSCIMMHLQKYLVRDVVHVLKITIHMRYYPKDYIQEFMSEAVSFLLRNAPIQQLIEGIRKIICEAVKKPLPVRKSGASAFLWHVMKGTSSRFHSRAEEVLRLILDKCIDSQLTQGSDTVVEVVAGTFQRIFEELHPQELNLLWDCLLEKISDCIANGSLSQLRHILSLLISTLQLCDDEKVSDVLPLLDVVVLLLKKGITTLSSANSKENTSDIVNGTMQLMLCLLDFPRVSADPSIISSVVQQWAPIFELRDPSLLAFIKGLLLKDPTVSYDFRSQIISALSELIDAEPAEVLYLMMTFFERLQGKVLSPDDVGISEEKASRICSFFQDTICNCVRRIDDIANGRAKSTKYFELSELWGTLSCCPHVFGAQMDLALVVKLIDALDQLLMVESGSIAGIEKRTWRSLLGATLASYHKLLLGRKATLAETSMFLDIAKKHKSSSHVLFSVAEFLDSVFGNMAASQADTCSSLCYPELHMDKTVDAIDIFADNLSLPDKAIRLSTLRILCHYEPSDQELSGSDHHVQKKLKLEGSQSLENSRCSNVIQLLYLIETTPVSISTSRKLITLISRIQMGLSAAGFSELYIPLLLNGLVGILYNRFSHLWEPVVECLTILVGNYVGLVWDRLVQYLERCQFEFLLSNDQLELNAEYSNKSNALVDSFKLFVTPNSDCTPQTTILSLLLQSVQRVPAIAESRSRQIIPLFLKFLGYSNDEIFRVGSFSWYCCKGKDWKLVLKGWLNLLRLMRNPCSLYQGQFLKEVLVNRLLDETDPDIQLKVLDCLLNWKDEFLLPYVQHLKNLIASKKNPDSGGKHQRRNSRGTEREKDLSCNLREELTAWNLSKESHHIQEGHREYLIPIIIRLLIPKVRKLKTLTSRKDGGLHHRRSILFFLAQLDVNELPLFFSLLLKPLQPLAYGKEGFYDRSWSSCECFVNEFQASNFLGSFITDVNNLTWKKRSGFLHVVEDILRTFDELHIRPFLNILMAFIVRILESCKSSLSSGNSATPSLLGNNSTSEVTDHENVADSSIMTNTSLKQIKDLRSLCLKTICTVLNKYDNHHFDSCFLDIFFISVKPLIDSFKQEGSSSEKPSSLFSCFLAMSRSPNLVYLLGREENLVPTIFSILTVKTASDAIITSVLIFIENLLNLDNDMESHEDCAVKQVLLPHLGALIHSLHQLFLRHKVNRRNSFMWPGKIELRIFKLLSKYIKDPLAAMHFIEIMLPSLGKKALNSDECMEGLIVVQGIMPVLSVDATGKVLNAVTPLLVSSGLEIRLSVCTILDGLAIKDPSLVFLAKLLWRLNAVSVSDIGELDYDTRVGAYDEITPELFTSLKQDHAVVILSHCVYDMSSAELILRQSASRSLLSFVRFAASVLECEAKECKQLLSPDETYHDMMRIGVATFHQDDFSWTKSFIQQIISKLLLLHMGEAMSKEISIQKEWIALLQDMVRILPELPSLNAFRCLCSEDAEVDFFNNILHLQKHRRARALSRFRNVICDGNMGNIICGRNSSGKITMKVFVPLFFNMLIDVKDGKGEHVRNACLDSLAAISGYMHWESYYAFLMRCFQEIVLNPDKHKVLARLICAILERFHFSETICSQETHYGGCEASILCTAEGRTPHLSTPNCFTPLEIETSLQKRVLPQIQKLLTSDTEKVNVTMNLAALKLLKLLPSDTLDSQLPSIIHRISNFLKSRLESVRDEARSALAACSKELGLEYFHFIVKVLRATLKRGFELHVLGYTLNFILSKTLSNHSNGKLDYCAEELLSVAENDILGEIDEEKEVEKIAAKMKETRKRKSFDTVKLISQSITFKSNAWKLLSPIKAHLQKHLTPKVKAKLEWMLRHVAAGIECNPSVDQTDLFIFVYGLIEDGIAKENLHGKDLPTILAYKQSNWKITGCRTGEDKVLGYESQNSHLVAVFALDLLHNRLKNKKFDKEDEKLLSMLDPFVGLLGNCLSSKYEDIISAAVKCLIPLIRLPLPSLGAWADDFKILLFDFVQKSGSNCSPLIHSCLKLLTVLLQSTRISLSSDQLRLLIQSQLFVDLETNPSSVALSLLKAVVARKFVVHEIYDVVTRVAELMVTSQQEHIRKKCSQILLQFLLDYHLSEKRLQQHLDFLLANLRYEHLTGRKAVLEMLHQILVKFPKSVVDSQAQTFFLHLVVCLANDSDNEVRSMVGTTIKHLIKHASQHALHPILEYSLSWYMGEKQHLWSAAAQVLGLLVEVSKEGFQMPINRILKVAQNIMTCALENATEKELDFSSEAAIPFWKEAYYSLVMLEKILLRFPELYLEKYLEEIWEAISKFLLHPHIWLRNISNRLIAFYFTAVSKSAKLDYEKLNLQKLLLMKPSLLFTIAVSLCCQLKEQVIDHVEGNLIAQNLVFAVCGLHSFARQRHFMHLSEFWSGLDKCEKEYFLKDFELLGSRKERSTFLSLTRSDPHEASGAKDQNEPDNREGLQSLLVVPLLKRMGKLSLQMEDVQVKVVFNCFKLISLQIGGEGCKNYAMHMLMSLYKVCEGFAGKVVTEEVKQFAEEVCESIRRILGVEEFVQVYNLIRKNLKDKRDKRKREEKLTAAIDPVRGAKRKLRIAGKHRAHKKRKIMTMKLRGW